MTTQIAPRFAGITQFERCVSGARMTPAGFDNNGDLTVDAPNDPVAVAAIQAALRDLGYPIVVSFVYDGKTMETVRQFKVDQRLPVPPPLVAHDEVVGPGTSGRLNQLFTPPPTATPPMPTTSPLSEWQALISFRAPAHIQAGVNTRFAMPAAPARMIHAIEDARGPVNLDFYPVRISALPTTGGAMSADQLLEFIRRNFNQFVDGVPDGARFNPLDAVVDGAAWAPPFLQTGFPGAVISIDIVSRNLPVDGGSVVLAEIAADHWIFSTMWTPDDLNHPVSGNRQWGYTPGAAGEFIFYTRGADRTTTALDNILQDSVFGGGHLLWTSFQRRLAAFVNNNGGVATVGSAISQRHDWPSVQRAHHHPKVSWLA